MTETDGLKNVDVLINRFGGMRPMARKMDVAVSTIQGWKKRDHIPSERVDDVVAAARANHVSLEGIKIPDMANQNERQSEKVTEEAPLKASSASANTAYVSSTSPTRPQYTINPAKIRAQAVRRSVFTTLGVLAVLGGMGYVLFGQEVEQVRELAHNQEAVQQRFNSLETTMTNGLNALGVQVDTAMTALGLEQGQAGEVIYNKPQTVMQRIEALEARFGGVSGDFDLGQLMTKFQSMTLSAEGQTEMQNALADLKNIVLSMQGEMGELNTSLEQAQQDNDALSRSLENVSQKDLGAAAMLLALTQMRTSLDRSEPFADDLAMLKKLAGEDNPELQASIDRLAPYAESGVLTPEGLSEELRGLSSDIAAAKLRGENVSIKDKIMARLSQILSINKDGQPVMGTEDQKIVAAAQAALDRGDVRTAMQALNKLDGQAAQTAQPLVALAQQTLSAENLVTDLMQDLLAKMQGGRIVKDEASGVMILDR